MRLSSFKRIFSTDFEQQFQELVSKLSVSLNTGLENLYEALNNNISLKDNVSCTVKQFNIIVDSSGKPKSTTIFQMNKTGAILGITVLTAVNLTNSAIYPSSGVFVSWTQTQTGIMINNITGLQANQNYQLTLVAYMA